jgi:hypothetical protein
MLNFHHNTKSCTAVTSVSAQLLERVQLLLARCLILLIEINKPSFME